MKKLSDIVLFSSGSPSSRIAESPNESALEYSFYNQNDLEESLIGIKLAKEARSLFRTMDPVVTVAKGDLIFSLISGKAAIIQPWQDGYLITQNYVKLSPDPELDPAFLAFLLNENDDVRRQLFASQQGSITLKYTIKQLLDLQLPDLPAYDRQKIIGNLYFNQLKLSALVKRLANTKAALTLAQLKEASKHE